MAYITIDGDDIGRKITMAYLNNDEFLLENISHTINEAMLNIAQYLSSIGFIILFCAADGVVAKREIILDYDNIFHKLQQMMPINYTISAGVGGDLKESYIALMYAKSSGKNRIICQKN